MDLLGNQVLEEESFSAYQDSRGIAIFFKGIKIGNLHLVSMNPGALRGNHSHDQDEILCVLGGSGLCEISVENLSSGDKETVLIQNDMESYRIKAGLKHTVRNVGNNVFYLVCFFTSVNG